jgi:hypothetical protein
MSDFGYFPNVSTFGQDDASGYKTTVTSSGSANTKGSWAQLAASCPFNADGVILSMQAEVAPSTPGTRDYLVDIGVGGAGSEIVVYPNLYFAQPGAQFECCALTYLPMSVPSGTRVAARCQNPTTSAAIDLKLQFVAANGFMPQQTANDYGSDTANSRGTAVTGGAANTKGSYAQLVGSTAAIMTAAVLCIGTGSVSNSDIALDLAIGAAGSEVVAVPNIFTNAIAGGAALAMTQKILLLPLSIPSGTRVAARIKDSVGSGVAYVSLIGLG